MNKTKLTSGLLAGVIATTSIATLAYGAEGVSSMREGKERGPQVSEEVREGLRASFESNDYTAYTAIASENELKRTLTEEQFEEKITKHADRETARTAVADGDYNAWRAIVGDERATDVTSENFNLLTDMVQARDSEDEDAIDAAKEALKDAGIKKPGKKGHGKRGGHGNQKGDQ